MSRNFATLTIAFLLAATVVAGGAAQGANHQDAAVDDVDPGIDFIITGTNRAIYEPVNPPGGASKDECPLCYHRMLLNEGSGADAFQPFPGD